MNETGVEIERKYLLRALPDLPAGARVLRIDQGWLPGDRLQERLRRTRAGERTSYTRTVKAGAGIERLEIEEETTAEVFRALWRLTRGRRVRKLRYVVEQDDCRWEIDRFIGFELLLAEIELETRDQPVTIPPWLQAVLEREVTGEAAYTNRCLAR